MVLAYCGNDTGKFLVSRVSREINPSFGVPSLTSCKFFAVIGAKTPPTTLALHDLDKPSEDLYVPKATGCLHGALLRPPSLHRRHHTKPARSHSHQLANGFNHAAIISPITVSPLEWINGSVKRKVWELHQCRFYSIQCSTKDILRLPCDGFEHRICWMAAATLDQRPIPAPAFVSFPCRHPKKKRELSKSPTSSSAALSIALLSIVYI